MYILTIFRVNFPDHKCNYSSEKSHKAYYIYTLYVNQLLSTISETYPCHLQIVWLHPHINCNESHKNTQIYK